MMEMFSKTRRILLASGSGIVMLLGYLTLKANASVATLEQQQELLTLSDTLKENSADLGQLGGELGGTDAEQIEAVRQYIDGLSQQLAAGQLPSEEEVKKVNEQLGNLAQNLQPPTTETAASDDPEPRESAERSEPRSSSQSTPPGRESERDPSTGEGTSAGTPGGKTASDSANEGTQGSREPSRGSPSKEKGMDRNRESGKESAKEVSGAKVAAAGGQAVAEMGADVSAVEAALEQLPAVLEDLVNSFTKLQENLTAESGSFQEDTETVVQTVDGASEATQNYQVEIVERKEVSETRFQVFLEKLETSHTQVEESFQAAIETEKSLSEQVESDLQSNERFLSEYSNETYEMIEKIFQEEETLATEMENVENNLARLLELITETQEKLENQMSEKEQEEWSFLENLEKYEKNLEETLGDFRDELTHKFRSEFHSGIRENVERFRESFERLEREIEDNVEGTEENIAELIKDCHEYLQSTIGSQIEESGENACQAIESVLERVDLGHDQLSDQKHCCQSTGDLVSKIEWGAEILQAMKEELENYSV